MNKKIKDYKAKLDGLLAADDENPDWGAVREELLVKIGFFQHERFVHLIVTMAVALMLVMSFLAAMLITSVPSELLILTGLFLVLTVPYIIHYYNLENGVQELYEYYDRVCEKANVNNK